MMRRILIISTLVFLGAGGITAQSQVTGGQPEKRIIRIVDTLTTQEKNNRNPVITRSEIDSLIRQYNTAHIQVPVKEPVRETNQNLSDYLFIAMLVALFLLGILVYLLYERQKKYSKLMAGLSRQLKYMEMSFGNPDTKDNMDMGKEKITKSKPAIPSLEKKISDLQAELNKLTKENEGMIRLLKEYNGIQHDYDSLKHGISKAYKVKNYPGFDMKKADQSILQGVLDTERSVANYAYEKYLKPILTLTDAHKNNPARTGDEDAKKLLDLLVSLALLYTEYLYLRVNELAIGGKMVERIQGLSRGNGIDPGLLKKLSTEHGSRALVMRMVLDKVQLEQLSYPVFDETNLNIQ